MICRRVFPLRHTALVPVILASQVFLTPAAAETHRFGAAPVEWTGREVVFRNDLTSARDFPQEFHVDLTEGFTVRVVILHGPGDAPDTMIVIPPAGYIAVPPQVTVEEYAEGVIIVAPEGLS